MPEKYDHITPILFDLHWLGVRERIVFKVLLMVYKILNDLAPVYLCALFDRYVPGRSSLRSANPDLFLLKRTDSKSTTKTYGWRAFSVYAPFLWNNLPMLLRQSENVNIFKQHSFYPICINSIFLVCSYFILFTILLSVKRCET